MADTLPRDVPLGRAKDSDLLRDEIAARRKAGRARRKDGRAGRRDQGTAALRSAGCQFVTLDHGWHLRIEHKGEVIDFTPGSDSWSIKGKCEDGRGFYRGVRTLIRYLATGDLPGVGV